MQHPFPHLVGVIEPELFAATQQLIDLHRERIENHRGHNASPILATTHKEPPMAATAEPVLKPDFAAKRKHFLFTDEHEQLRESIRNFAIKELAPHAEEWEETTFPDSVFSAHGRAGLPRSRQA